MDPVYAVLLGIPMTFVALAHSCLHHFLSLEQRDQRFPVWVAVFPWPKRGRAVSAIAGLAALPFLWLFGMLVGSPTQEPTSDGALLVFLIFASPLLGHAGWLMYCIDRSEPAWAFVARQPSTRAFRLIIALPAAVNGFLFALELFT
jgi:hypothetical protein